MSLEQIIECVQTYGHQAYDDYDTFYLGRYTVRDDGTTLSVASDDWCAERNGGVWLYRGITEREFKEFCEEPLPSPYFPVEEAHDLKFAPKMTEEGYKPFLQTRSDGPGVYSLVKVMRGEEDFLIFVARYGGEFYHFKKYKVDIYGHAFNIFTKETEIWLKLLDMGLHNESETDC